MSPQPPQDQETDEAWVSEVVRAAADRVEVTPLDPSRLPNLRGPSWGRRAAGVAAVLAMAAAVVTIALLGRADPPDRVDIGPVTAPPTTTTVTTTTAPPRLLGRTTTVAPTSASVVPPGSLCAAGSQATLRFTPPIGDAPGPVTVQLAAPATMVPCSDPSDPTVTGVQLERLDLRYDSVACTGATSATATGTGTARWSDGSTSELTVTLQGLKATIEATSGRYQGRPATVWITANSPCSAPGTANLPVTLGPISLVN